MAYETEVARGIALLDEKIPGWRQRIDLDRLNMRVTLLGPDGCGCILTQLYGNYFRGLKEVGLIDADDAPYGFDVDDQDYRQLTRAWRSALTKPAVS